MEHSNSTERTEGTIAKDNNEGGDRKLIVNYLPQIYTNLELRNLFAPYGEIESVRIMKDSKTGYSYGYGFVNFKREEDANSARSALNGFELQNKHLKVSVARAPSDDIKHTNLYVTNLPRNTSESDLLQLFQPYGNIIHKKLLSDKYTNLPRGVAFVRYETREQASNAIQALHELIPQGHIEPIRVRLADDHGKRRASYLAGFQAGMGISSSRNSSHSHNSSHHSQRHHDNSSSVRSRYSTGSKRCSRSPPTTTYSSHTSASHHHHRNHRHRSHETSRGERENRSRNPSHLKRNSYRSEKPYYSSHHR